MAKNELLCGNHRPGTGLEFPLDSTLESKGVIFMESFEDGVGTKLRNNIRVGGSLPRSLEDLGRADCL